MSDTIAKSDDTLPNHFPTGPSPSLMMTALHSPPTSLPYTRADLLAIARASTDVQPPSPDRLASLPDIYMRNDSIQIELDEGFANDHSIPIALLAQDPPMDNFKIVSGSEYDSDNSNSLYDFSSLDIKPPVMVNFADPFKASNTFQGFPPLSRTSSNSSDSSSRAINLGERFINLRQNQNQNQNQSPGRKSSSSTTTSSFSSDSILLRKGSLNPWAAPFPLPQTTPVISRPILNDGIIPSLPLPKALPLSLPLPARPGPPPPHFVKKESATLPQPMSLPNVEPMSSKWLEEDNLSGNERRRRASEIGSSIPIRPNFSTPVSQSLGEKRPERLIKLGQGLRQSIAAKGQRAW